VRLIAVDHPAGSEALSIGDDFVTGTREPAVEIHAGDGTRLLLDGSASYEAMPGETLQVSLGSGRGGLPLLIEASGTDPSATEVLVPDAQGQWTSAGRLYPRRGFDALLQPATGSDVVRIVARGRVQLRFVGTLTLAVEAPLVRTAALLAANDGKMGDLSSVVELADNLSATLVGPDTLALEFTVPPLAQDRVRSYFLAVDATPVSSSMLSRLQPAPGLSGEPARFALYQNQPNPFSARTTLRFDLPVGAMVRLEVFDAQGRHVAMLANRYFPAGSHAVPWSPSTGGARLGPGIYFYRIQAGGFRQRRKMILLP
jgi:hypothetical protein